MIDRRKFLKLIGGSALMLSGCACPPKRAPLIEWKDGTGLTPLAPLSIQPKDIPLSFDVHTHLFNATDLHTRGYLRGPIAHSLKSPMRELVKAAAPLIEQIGQSVAISCGDEMKQLGEKLRRMGEISTMGTRKSIQEETDDEINEHINKIADKLFELLPKSDLARELDKADREFQKYQSKRPGAYTYKKPFSQDYDRIKNGMRYGSSPLKSTKAMSAEERVSAKLDPKGVLSFMRYMLSPRHHNFRTFQKAYSEDDGAFGIDACFAALVDFDYWLGCSETSSSLHDQVLLHEQLAVLSGGYVLPLVPYNPLTDVKAPGKSRELVRWAVEERGFVGVKIYPPMGFQPFGNDDPITGLLSKSDKEKININLHALYDWCQENGVPVMMHSAHSMGLDEAHDELPSPYFWDSGLKEYPNLRINAGHFGGDYRDCKGVDWPNKIVELMDSSAGNWLYADLGFEDRLLEPESNEARKMKELLGRGKSVVLDHVMYGSDWEMISLLNDWGAYAHGIKGFIETILEIDQATAKRKIFFENAARFYGLYMGQPNRKRLDDFYSRWNVGQPQWMERLDRT